MRGGHTVKRHFISRTATLGTVLGRHAPVVRKIYLSIQQAQHIPIDRGPRIVWHNWRWAGLINGLPPIVILANK